MKKKFLVGFLVIVMCFALTGCGENVLKPNDDNKQGEEQNNSDDVKLYSDDTKLVFDASGVYKIVYYFEGDTITGLEYYYNYDDATTAAYAISIIKSQYSSQKGVKSITQNGKYIVVKYNEDAFKNMTVEKVKQTYSYLEQVINNDNPIDKVLEKNDNKDGVSSDLSWPNNKFTQQVPKPEQEFEQAASVDSVTCYTYPKWSIEQAKAYVEKIKGLGFVVSSTMVDIDEDYLIYLKSANGDYQVTISSDYSGGALIISIPFDRR